MLHKDLPVTGADAQAFVGGLHIAAGVEDWPPCGRAHIVDHELAVPSEPVLTVPLPKPAELWIIEQPCEERIRDCGNSIIAAQACIQRRRLHGVPSCVQRSACHALNTACLDAGRGVCYKRVESGWPTRRLYPLRVRQVFQVLFNSFSILFQFLCTGCPLGDAHAARVLLLRRAGAVRPGQRTPMVWRPGAGPTTENLRPPALSGSTPGSGTH